MIFTLKQKIGPYHLSETFGLGTYGKVKYGRHDLFPHLVAIKILDRRKIILMDMVDKVNREIDVLKICNHPHVIAMFEIIHTSNEIFVITELLEGGEMFDYITCQGVLDEEETRRFIQQLICGMEYLHKHLIVHRDLKPENLILDKQLNIKIADFGLTNLLIDGNLLRTSCGSPNYASPEIVMGHSYLGPEVDIWSCGVIMYVFLCGSLPFDEETTSLLYRRISGGMYISPNCLGTNGINLVTRLLAAAPLSRITTDGIRRHAWFKIRLPRYLSFPTAKKAQLKPSFAYMNTHMVGIVQTLTKVTTKFVSFSLKKRSINCFTVLYLLVRDRLTPWDDISFINIETRVDRQVIDHRLYHKKGIKWALGKYWCLSLGFKYIAMAYSDQIINEFCRILRLFKFFFRFENPTCLIVFLHQRSFWSKNRGKIFQKNTLDIFLDVIVGVRLFRNMNSFVLDLYRMDGDVLSFLTVCDFLINEFRRTR